jgi:superoxide dismutase, Cu-Zn family
MRSAIIMVLALAGCATVVPKTTAPTPAANDVMAQLRAADGADRGQAILRLGDGSMRLTVDAVGLKPGTHGVHIHDVGKCDAPDFASAKAHWNPTAKMHGRDNPMGAHHGDLPNLMIGSDGRGSVSIDLPGTVAELLDADGASVVIHAAADDYRTDPSGNSGNRIACGVLTAP